MPTNLLQESAGVPLSRCHGVTASVSDVKTGKKFIDYNGELLTGTLSLSGNASASDVKSGKTFYSNSFTKQSGSLSLSGNATVENVLSGKTFYSNSFTKLTGTSKHDYSTMIFINGLTGYDNWINLMRIAITKNGNTTYKNVDMGATYEDEFIRARCTGIDGSTCDGYLMTKFTAYPVFATWYTSSNLHGVKFTANVEQRIWYLHRPITSIGLLFLV